MPATKQELALLNAQQFRDAVAQKRKTADVEIEGIGTVRLRSLSAGEAMRFQTQVKKYIADGRDAEELTFNLIACSWVDGDGQPLLPEDEGVELARSLDPVSFNAVAAATLLLNGFSKDAVEAAVGNSGASPNESTPIGSPDSSDTPT